MTWNAFRITCPLCGVGWWGVFRDEGRGGGLGSLQRRHNEHDGVPNHQPHGCLLNRLFRRRSKKASKLRVTALWEGNSPVTGEFEGPITLKMFPFDDVVMWSAYFIEFWTRHKTSCHMNGWPVRGWGNFFANEFWHVKRFIIKGHATIFSENTINRLPRISIATSHKKSPEGIPLNF